MRRVGINIQTSAAEPPKDIALTWVHSQEVLLGCIRNNQPLASSKIIRTQSFMATSPSPVLEVYFIKAAFLVADLGIFACLLLRNYGIDCY